MYTERESRCDEWVKGGKGALQVHCKGDSLPGRIREGFTKEVRLYLFISVSEGGCFWLKKKKKKQGQGEREQKGNFSEPSLCRVRVVEVSWYTWEME